LLTAAQKKYLAQVYNIAPDYAQGIYDGLPDKCKKNFQFSEVEKLSEDAHVWYKEKKFRPSQGEMLTGYAPPTSIYNV
jgi:catalase